MMKTAVPILDPSVAAEMSPYPIVVMETTLYQKPVPYGDIGADGPIEEVERESVADDAEGDDDDQRRGAELLLTPNPPEQTLE